MARPGLEVAEILRRFGGRYRQWIGGMSKQQARVVGALSACRTAALGGHVEACDACGHRQIAYNSCRDRHCPKCQAAATAEWLESERRHLLDVPYSHVVFTLPEALAALALQNPRVCYGHLFRAASQTLLQIAADPKHLGARIGFVAILHTWGQSLLHHPHLHCLVPAGGLSPDGIRWISCRPGFFLPVHVLGALFRGKYLALLEESYRQGKLVFHGKLRQLAGGRAFAALLREARSRRWVVYAKPPFGGAEPALKYLARYTHRIAISNARLLAVTETGVAFSWKDYAHGNRIRRMDLDPREFIRRFLLHVLPSGFVRIRRYGLLANCHREPSLARCRALLGQEAPPPSTAECNHEAQADEEQDIGAGKKCCPLCRIGWMHIIEILPRTRLHPPSGPRPIDSS
jgi:hypothetical protein